MTGYIHTTHIQGFIVLHDNFLFTLCIIRANIQEIKRNEKKWDRQNEEIKKEMKKKERGDENSDRN